MLTPNSSDPSPSSHRWPVYAGLTLIVVLAVLGSFYWIGRNVVLVGRDSAGHLEQTIFVARALQTLSPQAVFNALTFDDYRPPALYLLTQLPYWIFGRTLDAAQLPNVLLLAVIIVLTFVLARRAMSDGFALFAALLVSLLPMMTAMSRLYYMENLLTTMVLLALWALLSGQGFERRGWALTWGFCLGIALLVKWTAPIYLALPTLYVLWRADFWAAQLAALRSFRLDWRRALAALIAGVALALLWYWPNRELVFKQEMPLGDWLPLLWGGLWAFTIYALGARRSKVGNFWAAVLLATAVASLWYLPRIDFVKRLGDVAFGTDRGTQESLNLLNLAHYTRYFQFWLTHHMGLLGILVILPVALIGWLRRLPHWRSARYVIVIYWLMVASAYVILILLAQANPRNLAPLLPIIAILLADSLRSYARPLAVTFGVTWVAVLAIQWSIYTFDAMAWVYQRSPALWVSGDYLQWPASGSTDPGYWIHPDVLATIGSSKGDPDSLGILVDTWEIHRGAFRYLVSRDDLNITVNPLTESDSRGWSDALANRWILVKDGDNGEVKAPGLTVIERIRAGDPLFHQLYAPVKRYRLPSGDTVTLYHRQDGPRQPQDYPVILIETQPIADTLNQWWSSAATLVFGDRDVATWVGLHDLTADRVLVPPPDGAGLADQIHDLAGTIFVVSRYDPSGRDQAAQGSYSARELVSGDTTLAVFGRPQQPLTALPVRSPWDGLEITDLRGDVAVAPGQVLPVEMQMVNRTNKALKLSVRLVSPTGEIVAQNDVAVEPAVRLGLFVPPGAAPGDYQLAAVLYDPATLEPVLDRDGNQLGELARVHVDEP